MTLQPESSDARQNGAADARQRLLVRIEELERLRNVEPREEAWARAEAALREAERVGADDLAWRARLIIGDLKGGLGDLAGQGSEAFAALRWATERNDRLVAAIGYRHLASFYTFLADHGAALEHAIKGVELLDERTPPHIRAFCLLWLAIGMANTGSLDTAVERFRAAEMIAREREDVELLCFILNSRSFTHYENGDATTAIKVADELEQVLWSQNLPPVWEYIDTIARAQLGIARSDLAERTIRRFIDTVELDRQPPETLLTFAVALRTNGKLAEAQAALDECRATCDAGDWGAVKVRLLEEQAALFAAGGDFKQAYHTHRQYHSESEALGSREREARAKVLQTVYELEEAKRATHETANSLRAIL